MEDISTRSFAPLTPTSHTWGKHVFSVFFFSYNYRMKSIKSVNANTKCKKRSVNLSIQHWRLLPTLSRITGSIQTSSP